MLSAAMLYASAIGANEVTAQAVYLQQLQDQAMQMRLHEQRAWHRLMHYEDQLLRGISSTVDSETFFLAPNGKTDPAAELAATLTAFFNAAVVPERDEPYACAFIARYHWLDQQLGFDRSRMPAADCHRYETWHAALNPESLALIFPSAYLNSPSSMFGHTLLRIDAKGQSSDTRLLAYAVNFAANTQEENGALFAFKGLAGGYPGLFGIYPYYDKVKEYARVENRDLWEYRLNFSDQELDRLMRHLWEMRGVKFDYYFLKENCSYQLLALLEAARPQMRLTEQYSVWAIPTDTIRVLTRESGLIGEVVYRPALATELAAKKSGLDDQQTELVMALVEGRIETDDEQLNSLTDRQRARVLQVAHDLLYYRFQSGQVLREHALPRSRRILLARSKTGVKDDLPDPVRPPTRPDQGHATRRYRLGLAHQEDAFGLTLQLKPAYHDLIDPPAGYTRGSQIDFLAVDLRLNQDALYLDEFTPIGIVSLSPRDAFFKPISWQVRTGWKRIAQPGSDFGKLGFTLNGGAGLTYNGPLSSLVYGFVLADVQASSHLDKDYRTGLGLSLGVLGPQSDNWTLKFELGGVDYLAGEDSEQFWLGLDQQWRLADDLGIRLGLRRSKDRELYRSRVDLVLNWYL